MLPRYIAFKKSNLNYYCVFENVLTSEDRCIKLIPRMTNDLAINRLEHRPHDINIEVKKHYIRRTLRSAPFYKDYVFRPSYTGYEFMMVHDYETYYVPVLEIPDEKLLGERWGSSHLDYMFGFQASSDEIQEIKNSLSQLDSGSIVNYDLDKRSLISLVDRPLVHLPDYVIRGWLKQAVLSETCPISHDRMHIDDICSTPCYHVMSYSNARTWILSAHSCPVCRKSCTVDSLIRP